ncbi:Hypothetical predicted protein [Mytilus galloprovincialis]|uniref:Uncharacterized protein n=1 Tax=Mytilus galloprovincialis TaxID=29158 RepID=A0A8B6BJX4_MYTGA|nr:Hypothetical predicted protein [Mytilus galloprovincialis]
MNAHPLAGPSSDAERKGVDNFTVNGDPLYLAGPSSVATRNDGEEAIINIKGGATRSRKALNDSVEVVELQPSTQDERYDLIHFMREKREKSCRFYRIDEKRVT